MSKIVRIALEEDIGPGDITSRACVPEDRRSRGTYLAREPWSLPEPKCSLKSSIASRC